MVTATATDTTVTVAHDATATADHDDTETVRLLGLETGEGAAYFQFPITR